MTGASWSNCRSASSARRRETVSVPERTPPDQGSHAIAVTPGAPADASYTDAVGFSGHFTDAPTQLSYMQQRYYDPLAGRFLATDPDPVNGTGSNFNRYAYASNNPYRFVDPDGRRSRDLEMIYKASGATPPPRSPNDWLGPAIGAGLGIIMAPVVYVAGIEAGAAVMGNPYAAAQVFNTTLEIAAGDALGGTSLAVGSAAAAKAAGEVLDSLPSPRPFALGLAKYLDEFALQHDATTFRHFSDQSTWKRQVLERLADPDQKVLFNLHRVDAWAGITRAARGVDGPTDWELFQIYQNDFPNLEFWLGGQLVGNPFNR